MKLKPIKVDIAFDSLAELQGNIIERDGKLYTCAELNDLGQHEKREGDKAVEFCLVDTEAEIEEGDHVYSELNKTVIRKVYLKKGKLCYGMAGNSFIINPKTTHKAVCSSEDRDYMPMLSDKSISSLIEFYNEGKLPDNVWVDENVDQFTDIYGYDVCCGRSIKQNDQGTVDVTILDTTEQLLEEIENLVGYIDTPIGRAKYPQEVVDSVRKLSQLKYKLG